MSAAAIAYAVRVLRERKDGSEVECWLAPAAYRNGSAPLFKASLFASEAEARTAAEARHARVARVVPIVAVELEDAA
jgi:hypothetical protein